MSGTGANRIFGRREESHVLILASGERVRHMTIRPWMAALTVSFFGLFTIGYLSATAYLVLRDDLMGASMARQARMQHEYEDRIAALRAQVDRITSRQLLDQQVVEDKVEKLMEQQMALANRQGKLGSVLERAENSGLDTDIATPTEDQPLDSTGSLDTTDGDKHASIESFDTLMGKSKPAKTRALSFAAIDGNVADRADKLFSTVTLSLKGIEQEQLDHIRSLTANADARADKIHDILKNTGLKLPAKLAEAELDPDSAIGGPFVEPETASEFEASISGLDIALDRLERVKAVARKLPFANPAPNRQITSLFGNRVDPFFGRLAMHAGIDFRQKTGGKVRATGAGIVIHAGTSGGYGVMVEIDHGNGITTRYGHLSKVLVKEGDIVSEGDLIALSGSTGRSTGPHLHYEVRRNGTAVDPMRFLNAGLKLTSYIE
ncbi:M23 family metallopeptidase [Rhizobium sp. LjRoot254]|uniref:M23 family metallopeptidase n=1 Tax=Rhizobium sp. LjRoot254 TaxID=3342297 RepID=UPI003ECF698F